jgi:hypothetical protein
MSCQELRVFSSADGKRLLVEVQPYSEQSRPIHVIAGWTPDNGG